MVGTDESAELWRLICIEFLYRNVDNKGLGIIIILTVCRKDENKEI